MPKDKAKTLIILGEMFIIKGERIIKKSINSLEKRVFLVIK